MELQTENFKFPGMYRGKVLDNDDPSRLGRVKVAVGGIIEESIGSDLLPWATPAFPLSFGAGTGFGSFFVPDVNSWVWVFFENGDHNQPVYFAEAADGIHGLPSERTSSYPSTRVMKSPSGISVSINDSTGDIRVSNGSTAYIQIDGSGNITVSGSAITISGTTISLNP